MLQDLKAYYLVIGFLFLITYHIDGQDQKVADSLRRIYLQDVLVDSEKYELLRELAFNEVNDLNLALQYAEELIKSADQAGNNLYLHSGYLQKGNKKRLSGDLEDALDAYLKSSEYAKKANFTRGEGNTYITIADIYSISKHHENAMLYYHKAISILRQSNDSVALASAILNAGEEFFYNQMYDSAFLFFDESRLIFEKVNYPIGKAYSMGNLGMVYAYTGKSILAEQNIKNAIQVLEELEDYYPISVYLIAMCDIYLEKGDEDIALNYARRSLAIAQQYGLKEQISDANRKLAELYERSGNIVESYAHYKDYIVYRDSVNNIKTVQRIADLRTDFEVSQKQMEVDLLSQKRRNQRIINIATATTAILIFLLAVALYRRYIFTRKTNVVIQEEKKRSESLLLNILPEETARELKQNGNVKAQKFASVTVLFTDFKEFTKLVESVDSEHLIRSIDYYFKKFDEITTKFGLEKIKTIGDSYMCAGGIPGVNQTHAKDAIHAAREIIHLVRTERNAQDDLIHFDIRIGVHTGPVVAGVVGLKKWQYDIWGDTVNIASRMESNSEPGMINISETTYNKVRDEFPCKYRGEIETKNRGKLKMYFLL
jgi:class 3 adenylate cyclase